MVNKLLKACSIDYLSIPELTNSIDLIPALIDALSTHRVSDKIPDSAPADLYWGDYCWHEKEQGWFISHGIPEWVDSYGKLWGKDLYSSAYFKTNDIDLLIKKTKEQLMPYVPGLENACHDMMLASSFPTSFTVINPTLVPPVKPSPIFTRYIDGVLYGYADGYWFETDTEVTQDCIIPEVSKALAKFTPTPDSYLYFENPRNGRGYMYDGENWAPTTLLPEGKLIHRTGWLRVFSKGSIPFIEELVPYARRLLGIVYTTAQVDEYKCWPDGYAVYNGAVYHGEVPLEISYSFSFDGPTTFACGGSITLTSVPCKLSLGRVVRKLVEIRDAYVEFIKGKYPYNPVFEKFMNTPRVHGYAVARLWHKDGYVWHNTWAESKAPIPPECESYDDFSYLPIDIYMDDARWLQLITSTIEQLQPYVEGMWPVRTPLPILLQDINPRELPEGHAVSIIESSNREYFNHDLQLGQGFSWLRTHWIGSADTVYPDDTGVMIYGMPLRCRHEFSTDDDDISIVDRCIDEQLHLVPKNSLVNTSYVDALLGISYEKKDGEWVPGSWMPKRGFFIGPTNARNIPTRIVIDLLLEIKKKFDECADARWKSRSKFFAQTIYGNFETAKSVLVESMYRPSPPTAVLTDDVPAWSWGTNSIYDSGHLYSYSGNAIYEEYRGFRIYKSTANINERMLKTYIEATVDMCNPVHQNFYMLEVAYR